MKQINYWIFTLILSFTAACQANDGVSTTFTISDDVSLTFVELEFGKSGDKAVDCGNNYICLVDGRPLWGADGQLPETKLSKAVVSIKSRSIELDTSGMYDPLIKQSRKNDYQVINYFDDTWKVRGRFSDGAGSYYAEWLVTKSGSIRILLGDAELLYEAFDSIFNKQLN